MRITRLRDELLIGSVAISIVVALASMLAGSAVVRQQYMDQSHAQLAKASRLIDDNLKDRQRELLSASRQLATQKNLGSTLWYLAQYAQTGLEKETLRNTYLQLARDTQKIGRVAGLSRVAIYDLAGNLVSFSQSSGKNEIVGFVERSPVPVLMQATLSENEELSGTILRSGKPANEAELKFSGHLPQQETAHFSASGDRLAIESFVPIMGVAFDPATGKQEIKQLGLVAASQLLDDAVVDHLTRLTDVHINIFTLTGLSGGSLSAYQTPDWGTDRDASRPLAPGTTCNETAIDGTDYFQCLTPVHADKQLLGSIAVLQSKELVHKNIWQMIRLLAIIAAACLLIILPLAWVFATTVSSPLTTLSRIFRSVAGGEQNEALSAELHQLEMSKQRHDEMNDLTQSFIAMERSISQKLKQINEINASLEQTVAQRTAELRIANQELTNLVSHDALTGLPNRKLLADRVQQALAVARRNEGKLALLFIDLDEFKPINDTLGHEFGDQLLREAARRIQSCMRESDTVARFGGDEFIVLLPAIESVDDAVAAAEKIRVMISLPFELAGQGRLISTSIGIALFPEHGSDEATLLKNADAAMYQAKNNGRNTVCVFSTPSQTGVPAEA